MSMGEHSINQCVCPAGTEDAPNGHCLDCKKNWVREIPWNNCVQCPFPSTFTPGTGSTVCECSPGYFRSDGAAQSLLGSDFDFFTASLSAEPTPMSQAIDGCEICKKNTYKT